MKKLLVMLAIVAAAVVTQAASLKWGGAIAAADGENEVGSGAMAYLLYSDTAFGTITQFNTATQTTDAGGTLRQTHAITATEAANYAFAEIYDNSDYTQMNGYYAVVMVDGNNMYYNTFNVTEYSSATTPMQNKTVNMDWSGSDYLGDPVRSGTVVTPEPTSGLLMLVGLSALALRRRKQA